jgi:hypothetical protein|tara:strand:+ start:191 stop:379 length:189 start_codon:yes stop_codon:yes gene_type:complete
MSTAALNSQQKSLFQQGYDYSPQELRELAWGLRSQEALQSILRQGRDQVYNLGAMARWESTL